MDKVETPLITIDNKDLLSSSLLTKLFSNKVVCVRIKDFLDKTICDHISRRLLNTATRNRHNYVPDLETIGLSYHSCRQYPQDLEHYYSIDTKFESSLSEAAKPYESPIDQVVKLVLKSWPKGLQPQRVDLCGKMSPFVVRIENSGDGILPHVDRLEWEAPSSKFIKQIQGQVGVNLYLANAESGGQLELYYDVLSKEQFQKMAKERYGVERNELVRKRLTVKPEVGDLFLISTHFLHGVTPLTTDSPRVTLSSFLGYFGRNLPLSIWS